mgnify:CR=1 FL=1
MESKFHFAFNVTDLDKACEFYSNILGCQQGRRSDSWVDYNFFGHQLSLHLGKPFAVANTGMVDNVAVPMPHFGAVLNMSDWQYLSEQLIAKDVQFLIEPCVRFKGKEGEQSTMFFFDPFGNPIELKGFADLERIFD